jgi:hypothetical protein
MTTNIIKLATLGAFFVLVSSFGTVAIAVEGTHTGSVHKKSIQTGQHTTRNVNRSRQMRHRNFTQNHDDDGDSGRRHRRHRGIGFSGISINLGDIDSSCRYSYRKWQATGSRYWRSRYFDCVG